MNTLENRLMNQGERLLLSVHDLGLEYGFEPSVKLASGKFLENRFVVGIKKQKDTRIFPSGVRNICQNLQMPAAFYRSFTGDMRHARTLFFGFERKDKNATCKAYSEFGSAISARTPPSPPVLWYKGYKWNPSDNAHHAISLYYCTPLVPAREIIRRIPEFYGEQCTIPCRATQAIIALASSKGLAPWDIIFLNVEEKDTSRTSFDVNLYEAELTIHDAWPMIRQVFQYYGIGEALARGFYNRCGSKTLGHISGGINRDGQSFFTVYFGAVFVKKKQQEPTG
ncbi:MAG: hypothetical protein WCR47_03110 [Desulfoplanes sp.]